MSLDKVVLMGHQIYRLHIDAVKLTDTKLCLVYIKMVFHIDPVSGKGSFSPYPNPI